VCTVPFEDFERTYHFLYEVRPVITHRGLRLAASFTRDLADYTPLSIHNSVVLRREGFSGSYDIHRRARFGMGYWLANYSIQQPGLCTNCNPDVDAHGGDIYLTAKAYESDRFTIELGPRYEVYSFREDGLRSLDTPPDVDPVTGDLNCTTTSLVISAACGNIGTGGFFTPRVYQKWGGTVALAVRPHPKVAWNVESFIGQRRFYTLELDQPSEDFSLAGSVRTDLRVNWGRWETAVGYSFSATESPGFLRIPPAIGIGEYTSHYAFAEVLIRF